MKKLVIAGLVAGLVVGSLAPAQAAKKKKKPKTPPAPVSVDMKYFLHDTSCEADDNFLSLVDAPDFHCWYYDTPIYDAIEEAGLLTGDDMSQVFTTVSEGMPLTLDASKPLTGEITTRGLDCLADGACAPGPVGVGQAAVDITVKGEIDGEVVALGTFAETFVLAPTQAHTSAVSIEVDDALDKKVLTSLQVFVYLHGQQVGFGTVELDNPASFLTVPAYK